MTHPGPDQHLQQLVVEGQVGRETRSGEDPSQVEREEPDRLQEALVDCRQWHFGDLRKLEMDGITGTPATSVNRGRDQCNHRGVPRFLPLIRQCVIQPRGTDRMNPYNRKIAAKAHHSFQTQEKVISEASLAKMVVRNMSNTRRTVLMLVLEYVGRTTRNETVNGRGYMIISDTLQPPPLSGFRS